jgi:hypothetical protein
MKVKIHIIALCALIFFSVLTLSFSFKKKMDIEGYLQWYNENKSDFKQVQLAGDLTYTLFLIPKEMDLIRQYRAGQISLEILNKLNRQKKQNLAFRLEISCPQKGTKDFVTEIPSDTYSYDNRVKYYAFDFKNDIKFKRENSDTMQPQNYIFERGNGLVPYSICLIDFPVNLSKEKINLFIENKTLAHKVQFSFQIKSKTIPALKKIRN